MKKQYLNRDTDGQTIYLTDSCSEESRVSPEDAFTCIGYYGYETKEQEKKDVWDIINNVEGYKDIEDYGFCTIISEDYYKSKGRDRCFEEISAICEKRGHFPDYILVRRKGALNLIHQSNDFKSLKNKPFKASEERLDEGGGSFSIGLYVLDLTHNEHLRNESKWYTGVYEGYFYECVEDLHNGEKCGSEKIGQKEFFIPRGVETIRWS